MGHKDDLFVCILRNFSDNTQLSVQEGREAILRDPDKLEKSYAMIKVQAASLIWSLNSVLPSSLYFGNHLLQTLPMTHYLLFLEGRSMEETKDILSPLLFPICFTFYLSLRLLTKALQNLEHPWNAHTSKILLLSPVFPILSKVKQLMRNTTQRYALKQDGYGW